MGKQREQNRKEQLMAPLGGHKKYDDEKGFGLVEVLVGSFLLAFIVATSSSFFVQIQKQHKRLEVQSRIINLTKEMISNINSEIAWARTLSAPENQTTFSCLSGKDSSLCQGRTWQSADASFIFQLYDSEGNRSPHAVDTQNNGGGNSGLSYNGTPCSGFDPINGNDQCPFQVQLSWHPGQCTGSCQNLPLVISGRLVFKAQNDPYSLQANSSKSGPSNWMNDSQFVLEKNSNFSSSAVNTSGSLSGFPQSTTSGAGPGFSDQTNTDWKDVVLDAGILQIDGNIVFGYPPSLISTGSGSTLKLSLTLADLSSPTPPEAQTPCTTKNRLIFWPGRNTGRIESQSANCTVIISNTGTTKPGPYRLLLTYTVHFQNSQPSNPGSIAIKKFDLNYFLTRPK